MLPVVKSALKHQCHLVPVEISIERTVLQLKGMSIHGPIGSDQDPEISKCGPLANPTPNLTQKRTIKQNTDLDLAHHDLHLKKTPRYDLETKEWLYLARSHDNINMSPPYYLPSSEYLSTSLLYYIILYFACLSLCSYFVGREWRHEDELGTESWLTCDGMAWSPWNAVKFVVVRSIKRTKPEAVVIIIIITN